MKPCYEVKYQNNRCIISTFTDNQDTIHAAKAKQLTIVTCNSIKFQTIMKYKVASNCN